MIHHDGADEALDTLAPSNLVPSRHCLPVCDKDSGPRTHPCRHQLHQQCTTDVLQGTNDGNRGGGEGGGRCGCELVKRIHRHPAGHHSWGAIYSAYITHCFETFEHRKRQKTQWSQRDQSNGNNAGNSSMGCVCYASADSALLSDRGGDGWMQRGDASLGCTSACEIPRMSEEGNASSCRSCRGGSAGMLGTQIQDWTARIYADSIRSCIECYSQVTLKCLVSTPYLEGERGGEPLGQVCLGRRNGRRGRGDRKRTCKRGAERSGGGRGVGEHLTRWSIHLSVLAEM